jgi:hypothetical protein
MGVNMSRRYERVVAHGVKAFESSVFGPCIRISCTGPTNIRVCGFHQGKPHEVRQRQQAGQETRSTLWRTWGTRPEPKTVVGRLTAFFDPCKCL